jgi:hypothetical protein
MKSLSSVGASKSRRQMVAGLVFMVLTTAGAAWLMVLAGTYWDVYTAAGMRMPAVLEVVGRERWLILTSFVVLEIMTGLMAGRTRRPGTWLMVEAFGAAALVTILFQLLLGSFLVPIQEFSAALGP